MSAPRQRNSSLASRRDFQRALWEVELPIALLMWAFSSFAPWAAHLAIDAILFGVVAAWARSVMDLGRPVTPSPDDPPASEGTADIRPADWAQQSATWGILSFVVIPLWCWSLTWSIELHLTIDACVSLLIVGWMNLVRRRFESQHPRQTAERPYWQRRADHRLTVTDANFPSVFWSLAMAFAVLIWGTTLFDPERRHPFFDVVLFSLTVIWSLALARPVGPRAPRLPTNRREWIHQGFWVAALFVAIYLWWLAIDVDPVPHVVADLIVCTVIGCAVYTTTQRQATAPPGNRSESSAEGRT